MVPSVTLELSSLYIATELIPTEIVKNPLDDEFTFEPNTWHWSFFFTDSDGGISQHHWNIGDYNGSRGEFYQSRILSKVLATTADSGSVYVAFTKVAG